MRSQIHVAMPSGFLAALLLCLLTIQGAAGDELDLKSKWWPNGSALDLQKMEAKDIERIQICRLEWSRGAVMPNRKEEYAQKKYATRPLTHEEDTQEIEGLLTLIKRAERPKKPGKGEHDCELYHPPDSVLVVQPVQGQPFEILFSSHLDGPFGEVYSLELKEALYALAGGITRFSIIHFDKGKVQRTIHYSVIAPHQGGSSSQTTSSEMHLASEKGLTLYLKVREGKDALMEDEKPMHYGEAKVFKSSGPGNYIVLLHKP
jgi:hypothetical protein